MATIVMWAGETRLEKGGFNTDPNEVVDGMFKLAQEFPLYIDGEIMKSLLKMWARSFHSYEWDKELESKTLTEVLFTEFGRVKYHVYVLKN